MLNLASQRNSPDRSTKSTRFHIKHGSTACKHMVSGSVSLPSRGPFHRSFTVLGAIGHYGVFSLTGWSPHIQSRFHVSRGTPDPACFFLFSRTRLSLSLAGFPKTILLRLLNQFCGPNPGMHASRFGLFRFRSPLLTESHVVFSSSGYLDVSVHRVPSAYL